MTAQDHSEHMHKQGQQIGNNVATINQSTPKAKLIAIIVCCTVGGLAIIAAIVFCLMKRRRQKYKKVNRDQESGQQLPDENCDKSGSRDSISADTIEREKAANVLRSPSYFDRLKRQLTGRGRVDEAETQQLALSDARNGEHHVA